MSVLTQSSESVYRHPEKDAKGFRQSWQTFPWWFKLLVLCSLLCPCNRENCWSGTEGEEQDCAYVYPEPRSSFTSDLSGDILPHFAVVGG